MTIEIAAWVLTGCLLVCIVFMVIQERRHRELYTNMGIQLAQTRDRRDELEAICARARPDPRAGLFPDNPANPDAEIQEESAPSPRLSQRYVATRAFAIGNTGVTIPEGRVVQFDGRNLISEGRSMEAPQVRGAITGGWLRPVSSGSPEAIVDGLRRINEPRSMVDGLRGVATAMQDFSGALSGVSAGTLPDDWQERLTSPEAIEGIEPRCYEVTDAEAVMINGQLYEPGSVIPIEAVARLAPSSLRKFQDAGRPPTHPIRQAHGRQ